MRSTACARVGPLMLFAVLLSLSCVTPATNGRQTGPIKIGLLADLSAAGAHEGNDALKGARLRVKELMSAGGIAGRAVVLMESDIKQSPTEAVKAYTRLAQDEKACAVIGPSLTNSSLAVSPVADLVKVPVVSLCNDDRVTNPEIKPESGGNPGAVRQFTFSIRPSDSQMASAMAAYAVESFGYSLYGTLSAAGSAASLLQAEVFARTVRAMGKTVVFSGRLPQAETDYPPVLARIRDSGAEAVFVCAATTENAAVAARFKELRLKPLLIGNSAWYAPFLEMAGDAGESAWFPLGVAPDDPGLKEFSGKFEEEFGEQPSPAAIAGWDAAGLIIAAVRKAGSSDPQKIRRVLEEASGFESLTGVIRMDKTTHRPIGITVAIMRISGGRYTTMAARYLPKPAQGGSASP